MKWKKGTTKVEKREKNERLLNFIASNTRNAWQNKKRRKRSEGTRVEKKRLLTNSHTNAHTNWKNDRNGLFIHHSAFTLRAQSPYEQPVLRGGLLIFFNVQPLLSRTFVIFLIMSLHKNTATGPKNNVYRKKGMARGRNGTRAESQAQCERDR